MQQKHSYSIRKQLLKSVGLSVAFLMLIISSVLDISFKQSLESERDRRLEDLFYLVLAAANYAQGELSMPDNFSAPTLSRLGSGHVAAIFNDSSQLIWQSSSLADDHGARFQSIDLSVQLGQSVQRSALIDQQLYLVRLDGVAWETDSGLDRFTVLIAEDQAIVSESLMQYREPLWIGLASVLIMTLWLFVYIIARGLKPLKEFAKQVNEIEEGKRDGISDYYPIELSGLALNLNNLIDYEKEQKERYKNTLANLAHSLKTPLALMKSSPKLDSEHIVHIDRMDEIVQYHLKRAVQPLPTTITEKVNVHEVVARLGAVLKKVYADKGVEFTLSEDSDLYCKWNKDDLLEVLGNLLDNAFKYGVSKVSVRVCQKINGANETPSTMVVIEDDGPGIPTSGLESVMDRGARFDEREVGQGLGLAVVAEIVSTYSASIELSAGQPPLYGLRATLVL